MPCVAFAAGGANAAERAEPDDRPSYSIRVWQHEQGLPQNSVTAIAQDRDGYLWMGTYDGLVRFDGARFAVFDGANAPGLENGRITSLFNAQDGSLWIGHETGNVTRLKSGRFIPVQPASVGPNQGIVGIAADLRGKIWVFDQSGRLKCMDDGRVLTPNDGLADALPYLVFAPSDSEGIAVARNGVLSKLDGDELSRVAFPDQPGDTWVGGAGASRKGGLWLVTQGQVRRWQNGQWVENLGPVPWKNPVSITAVVELQNGAVAIGTLASGLYLLFPDQPAIHLDRKNGLTHDRIRCIYEDPERNIWIGTGSGGVVALREACFTTLDAPDRWNGQPVLAVTPSRDGGLWIGTEGGGIYQFNQGTWRHFGQGEGLSNQFVWSLSEGAQRDLWVGTWGGGLFKKLPYGRFFREPALDSSMPVFALLLSPRDHSTWIGTGAGLLRLADGNLKTYGVEAGLVSPDVRAVVEDEAGTIWIGMLGGGLASVRDGVVQQFGKKDGLTSLFVHCLLPDRDNVLWIGSTDGGLIRLKDGHFSGINSSHGLPTNVIGHIADDGLGFLWISSPSGIFRIAKDEANRCADGKTPLVQCQQYGRSDGLRSLECTGGQGAGCRTADGHLWFTTISGLVTVDPKAVTVNPLPPKMAIEELRVEGVPLPRTESVVEIPPGKRRLELQYAGLSFAAPDKVKFRHRLRGLETQWTDAGPKREVSYNYLPPGRYHFEVVACNNDGIWSEQPAAIDFTVLPFVWQTWWFRGLATLGVLSAAGLAGRAVTRRRMKESVERAEREQALERERTRIARDIHDDLGASLTRIALLSQSSRSEIETPEQMASDLQQIYGTTREVTRAMDEIVWAVNPKHDSLDSLATYLGKYADDYLRASAVRCRLAIAMELPVWRLTAEIRHNLFLAFKETLHNVVKHAQATEVRIGLTVDVEKKTFALTIEDNGRGFDAHAALNGSERTSDRVVSGYGLNNISSRLAEIGGRCEVVSQPGQGSRTSLVVQLRPSSGT